MSVAERQRSGKAIPEPAAENELPGWPPGKIWGLAKHVAAVLECDVDTVYKMRALGHLRARAHGERAWRFHRDDLLRFVRAAAGREEPAEPTAEGPVEQVLAMLPALSEGAQLRVAGEAIRLVSQAVEGAASPKGRRPQRPQLAALRGGRP